MRKGICGALAALLAGAGIALGEAPPAAPVPVMTPPRQTAPAPGEWTTPAWCDHGACMCEDTSDHTRLWANAEYLLWWVKDAPLPPALVTTGSPTTDNPGALGHGGVPIFGDRADLGTFSGVRVTAGGWLDSDEILGLEVGGFVLSRRVHSFRAESDPNGNPVIAFRYLDPPVNGVAAEDAFQASVPPGNPFGVGPLAGGLDVVSTSRLWGLEANAVSLLTTSGSLHLEGLVGFRYLELDENLNLSWHSQALDGATVTFLGGLFPSPDIVTSNDNFHAKTHFYGGQIGVRGEYGLGKAFVGFCGKVALGDSHEVVTVSGFSTLLLPATGTLVTATAGQFAGPSNIGRLVDDSFAVVPEVEVKAGYNIMGNLRAFVGYDFLYWSRVVRPGNQVDLIVDNAQNPVNPGFNPANPATMFPRPLILHSSYWAQGVNFGLEFRY
jgi:hypothetical protein